MRISFPLLITFVLVLLLPMVAVAQDDAQGRQDSVRQLPTKRTGLSNVKWDVAGVERSAWVWMPKLKEGEQAPLVFVWHGHGGNARGTARKFKIHEHWPEAIVVYPQGLKTPGFTDPEGKRSGWKTKGDPNDNRDLKFFDVILADLTERGVVDSRRVYSTGHSNGGGFTYALLFERGEVLAAIAPSSGVPSRENAERQPVHIPILHLAGKKDGVVKMAWQQMAMDILRRHNQCGESQPWGDHPLCKVYPSKVGAPVVTYVHPGGHRMPTDAGKIFVMFFKEHAQPVAKTEPPNLGKQPDPSEAGDPKGS